MAKDRQGLSVHAVTFAHGRGPVFYASLPGGPGAAETLKGWATNGAGDTDKQRLVSTLWDHLVSRQSPIRQPCQFADSTALPIQVVRGVLGRPRLQLGAYRGPAISFSAGGGKVWAALCGDASDIGIDAAGTDEFQSDYPFHRVFQAQELHHALRLTGADLAKAAALLWSIKEAVVKALGCAFHRVDPRQITVYPAAGGVTGGDGGHTFAVGLSGKALVRFPLAAGRSLWARSLPQEKMWLSIALSNRKPAG